LNLIFDPTWFDPADSFRCRSCDTIIAPIERAIYGLESRQADLIMQFFAGDLDSINCMICGQPTGFTRSIALLVPDHNTILVQLGNFPGSYRVQEKFEGGLQPSADGRGGLPMVVRCESGIEVRRGYGKMYRRGIQAVVSAKNRGPDFVRSNLEVLTPRNFLATTLALYGLLPGADVESRQGPVDRAEVEQSLAEAQALTWFVALQEALKAFDDPDGGHQNLEQLLQQNFDNGMNSKVAVARFEGMRDQLLAAVYGTLDVTLPRVFEYVFEAGAASLYAGRQDENPSKAAWANSYFRFEATTRLHQMMGVRRALAIAPGRTAATLSYTESVDAVARIMQASHKANAVIVEIAGDLGFAGLLEEVVQGMSLNGFEDDPAAWLDFTKNLLAGQMSLDGVLAFSSIALAFLTERRPDRDPADQSRELESFADALISHIDANFEEEVRVNVWLASHLKLLGLPLLALSRLGEKECDRDSELEVGAKLSLWTERFNALRLCGRTRQALELAIKIDAASAGQISEKDQRVAKRNLAIAMREAGDPEGSLSAFWGLDSKLRQSNASVEEQLNNLDSICISSGLLGDHQGALDAAERGMHLSIGRNSGFKPRFVLHGASALIGLRRYEEARALLKEPSATLDGQKVEEINLWLGLWANHQLGPDDQEYVEELSRALPNVADAAAAAGDLLRLHGTLLTAAQLAQTRDASTAEESWRKVVEVARNNDLAVPPEALVRLATYAFQKDRPEAGMDYLKSVPEGLAQRVGESSLLGLKSSSKSLEAVLHDLVNGVAKQSAHWSHLRFSADIGRDLHWKSTLLRSNHDADRVGLLRLLETGFDDSVVSGLRLAQGNLLLLEWIRIQGGLYGCSTLIAADGEVATRWIDMPDIDLTDLGERIRARLDGWSSLFKGDPFDLPEWMKLESWFQDLCKSFSDVRRVVIIEHELFRQLPFHVLGGESIPISYSSSWCQALLSAQPGREAGRSVLGLGVALQRGDGAQVLDAARFSAAATQELAMRASLELCKAVEADFDQDRFNELLAKSDLLKLICHGLVLPGHEIAFVLSHWGRLPPRSLSLATPMGRSHTVALTQLQGVARSPRTIWSGACSSGTVLTHVRIAPRRIR